MYAYLIVPKTDKNKYAIQPQKNYTAISLYEDDRTVDQFLLNTIKKNPNHVVLKVFIDEQKPGVSIRENTRNGTYDVTFQRQNAMDIHVIEEINLNRINQHKNNHSSNNSSSFGKILSSIFLAPFRLIASAFKSFAKLFQSSKPEVPTQSVTAIAQIQQVQQPVVSHPMPAPFVPVYPEFNSLVPAPAMNSMPVQSLNYPEYTNYVRYAHGPFFAPQQPNMATSQYADVLQHVNEDPGYFNQIQSLSKR